MKIKKKSAFGMAVLLAVSLLVPVTGCASQEDKLFANNVTYSAFGAAGDGKTNDFAAIKKAHEYANEKGVAVKADKNATYYIGAVEDSVPVKTNTDWSDAEFIIDDKSAETDSKVWWYPLFRVLPETEPEAVELPEGYSLSAGQKNIGLKFGDKKLLAVYNEEKRDFIRHASSDSAGYPRQEVILTDKNGNVDSSTPLQWDYEKVTKMNAYSVSDQPLLLRGGKFTTIANDDPKYTGYYERGIKVERANVTVKNVAHYVTDEGETGSPYNGFFRAQYANNVVFESCVMTGHTYYYQGTYDTRLYGSNNVRYLNCVQSNDHTDPKFWGIMCSDFCKNLTMDGCKLSRFDAHMGVYNATIKNSDIGQHISLVGGGLLRVENVIRRCAKGSWFNRFVTLRDDYGSFFYGDIIIKDSKLLTGRGINYVIAGAWYDWDFGYECRLPNTVTLDNVTMEYEEGIEEYLHPCLFIFSHFTEKANETPEYMKNSTNPLTFPEKVIIKNNATNFKMTANTLGWFEETQTVNK